MSGYDDLGASLQPLAGGFGGETYAGEVAGERTVVRIYGDRSAWRGPQAPEIDAAVLRWVRGLLPVAEVLEARPGDPEAGVPGLLVTSWMPGTRLDLVLPGLAADGRARVGAEVGVLLGRLGHIATPRPGLFADRDLTLTPLPEGGVAEFVGERADRLPLTTGELAGLREVAEEAQALLDEDARTCLVHSDLNPKNLLVDPATLRITALVDWEFAHSGSPYADLGNLLRFDRDPAYADAVLASYTAFMPSVPADLLDRARAADLVALVDLSTRAAAAPGNTVAAAAADLLAAIAAARDLRATPA